MRYWEERAKEWAEARDKKEHKINAALVDSYKNAADDLQKEIAAWYEKYADAEGISFADAKKRLNERERRALTRSVKAFEKLAKQNKDHSQDKILAKMSAAVHVNRLTSMQFQMRYILYELYSDVNNELTDGLKNFYADEREQMAYEAQMARGKFEPIATIDEKRISAVLKIPWATDGKDFSARLWNNREQLVSTLQSELTRALITGADSVSVAKTIAQKMNAAQYAAARLVSTEITRIITASDIDTFAEMDIDEVEVVGTLDLHTCDTCGDMDGNHMPRTEAKEGITAPPFHPNCRCVIVPYDEEFRDEYRIMRDPVTGKSKMIENMTFKEWKEKYGSGERKSDTKEYGAYNAKNDPDWKKRNEHAKLYYKEIRQNGRETFVRKISQNTELRPSFIGKVYDHVFVNKHHLDDGFRLLDESYYMAVAFQRLLQGNQTDNDVLLLYHERLEWALENKYNIKQRGAHKKANEKHNFEITIDAEGDETG